MEELRKLANDYQREEARIRDQISDLHKEQSNNQRAFKEYLFKAGHMDCLKIDEAALKRITRTIY